MDDCICDITAVYYYNSIKAIQSYSRGTFQCKNGDLNMYSEQTANHPITSNFYCFDDNRNYTISGYIITTASTGANTITAIKTGKYNVTFKD